MQMETAAIRPIPYSEAGPFWASYLWPNRPESLRPTSSMLFEGGFDVSIHANHSPIFFGLFHERRLVGINSGHFSSRQDFRSRGLYVQEEFRGFGYGALLLGETEKYARSRGAELLWSYPKASAWNVYERAGFCRTDRRLKDGDDNFYAFLAL